MISTIEEYKSSIVSAEAVSFDIFDTLIHRVVFRPKDVFEIIKLKLSNSNLGIHSPELLSNFVQFRISAEEEARKRFFSKFGTHEVSLREIYEIIAERCSLEEKAVSSLIQEEIDLENFLVYPNPLMKSLFDYAKSIKKPVILCSDMYLTEQTIEKLLASAGYFPPYKLYVSGTLKKSKHEGTIFSFISNSTGIESTKFVHFGDNRHADFDMPIKSGLTAHHFTQIKDEIEPKLRFKLPENPPHKAPLSLTQGVIQKGFLENSYPNDFWFDIGFQIFGPLFLGKFLWFINELRNYQPDKILFFARDAHIHHHLYLKYGPALGLDIPCDYAYFSRASLLIPSLTEFRIDRIWFLYSGKAGRTVSEHLKKFGIDATTVSSEILNAGFSSANEPVTNGCPHMFKLLKTLFPQILRYAAERRKLVSSYVKQLAGSSKRIALLDIGWVGNMQSGFSRILQLENAETEVRGYYYGTFEHVKVNSMPRNQFCTYLVNECMPQECFHALVSGGVELLEFAQMAPHGTTLGYTDDEGLIQPILEDNQDDEQMRGFSFRLQEGAEAFIEAIMPFILEIGVQNFISKDWAEPFFRLVNNPTAEEAEILGEITHSDAPSGTSVRLKLAPKLTDLKKGSSQAEYVTALENCFWKAGFHKRNDF